MSCRKQGDTKENLCKSVQYLGLINDKLYMEIYFWQYCMDKLTKCSLWMWNVGPAFLSDWGWFVVLLYLWCSSTLQRLHRRGGRRRDCLYYLKGFWHSGLLNQQVQSYFFCLSVLWACPLVWRNSLQILPFLCISHLLARKVNLPAY